MSWRLIKGDPWFADVCRVEGCVIKHHEGHDHGDPGPTWGYDSTENPRPKALMVVAHPDDETIFGAGIMLAYPDWDWQLVTMMECGGTRQMEFIRATELYAEEGVQFGGIYSVGLEDEFFTPGQRKHLLDSLADLQLAPDIVFTHGFRGEYGHQHHIAVHYAVHSLYDTVFDFLSPGTLAEPQLIKGGANAVEVTEAKRRIFDTAYSDQAPKLRRAMPALIERQMAGPEYYTR